MSNEMHSPVKMVTAAYLDPSYFSEEPVVPGTAKTQNSSQTIGLEKTMRIVSCVMAVSLFVAFLCVAPMTSMKLGAGKKDRRLSGVNWMLWAAGAKKSNKQKLLEKIEHNRKVSMTPSAADKAKLGKDAEPEADELDQGEDQDKLNDS